MTSKSAGQRSRSAKQSMTESFAAFGDRDTYLAITGRGDAAKTVLVPGRPGFIYVRLPKSVVTGTLEEYTETQAFSQNEYRHGVPVTVQKAEDNPSRYEVVDTWTVGMGEAVMQAVTTNVSHHRTSHEVYGTVGGHDPVMLHSVQIRNLQVTPTSPPSSKVVIGAGWYIYKHRGINWFDGVELDMADKVPTGTLSHNYVSLWLDPVTDQIVTRENANLALASFKKPLSDLVEWPVEDFIPLAAVRLSADNYVVRWQADGEPNIIDMRPHQAMMPGDMLPAGHPLDPVGGYHTGTLQSVHVTYDNASGSFAGDNVQDILTEIGAGGAGGTTGTIPIEEDDLLVMGAVRLNFEGDDIYDLSIIDEGAGKATITGSFTGNLAAGGGFTEVGSRLTIDEYIHIRDERAQNTGGGDFISGAWRTRFLNTIVSDVGNHASLAGNQITLDAGTYMCHAFAGAHFVQGHQLRLQDIDNTLTLLLGASTYAEAVNTDTWMSVLHGVFTLTSPTTIELQHQCVTTRLVDGFGRPANITTEVHASIEFWKIDEQGVAGSTGTLQVEEDDFLVMGATTLNFEGDPIYDIGVIDEGAGKGTITGSFDASEVTHGDLNFLTADTHPIYALLAGRSGGQTLIGGTGSGDDLTLQSTSHATKGTIFLTDSAVVINENGGDFDLRVEGDTEQNLLFVDASTDWVGMGTGSPSARLHIADNGGTGNLLKITADDNGPFSIVFENALAGTNDYAVFLNSSGNLRFDTPGSLQSVFILAQDGRVGIGDTTPDAQLDVQVGAAATVGLIVQGAASQSASLFQLLDSSGNIIHTSGDGLTGSEFVINEFGTDIDFRVEGDTQANMIIVDAGTNTMGIGGAIVSGKVLGVNGQTEIRGSVTTNPQLRLRNESYTSADSSGTVGIDFFFGNHGAVRIDAWKQTVNTTGLRFWTEVGFGVPVQSLEITPRGLVAFNAHSVLTNAVTTFDYKHNTTGTPAAGLGVATRYFAESSTTEDRELGRYVAEWVTVTDASRKARVSLTVYDTAEREGIRLEASGSAPMLGFFGSAAVARQTGYTTFTNLTTDRTLDADATTVGELADVLGTLIEDLKSLGLIAA